MEERIAALEAKVEVLEKLNIELIDAMTSAGKAIQGLSETDEKMLEIFKSLTDKIE